jgi:hypothetical protein
MDDVTSEQIPLACTLTPAEGLTRMQRWQRLHDAAQLHASHRDGWVEVTYRRSADVASELDELVEAERECCAFAAWDVVPRDDVLMLTIRPRSVGDRAAVAELGSAFGASSYSQRDHSS